MRKTTHFGRIDMARVPTRNQSLAGSSIQQHRAAKDRRTSRAASDQSGLPTKGFEPAQPTDKIAVALCLLILLSLYVFIL